MIELSYVTLYLTGLGFYFLLTTNFALSICTNTRILTTVLVELDKQPKKAWYTTTALLLVYPITLLYQLVRNFPIALRNIESLK